jgi:hypothetical protein
MTTVFTDAFRTQLFNSLDKTAPIDPSVNLFNPAKNVYWVFFRNHAEFTDANDPRYTAIDSIADLAAVPGWSAPLSPNSATHPVGSATAGTVTYCIDNNSFVMGGGWVQSTVSAAALVLVGSPDVVILVTDDPFGGRSIVMDPDDSLIARPISAIPGNRALFSWPVFVVGSTQVVPSANDTVALLEAPPDYEMAYTQHAWVYPQRANFIANPSFEASPGTNHWRGSFARLVGTESVPAAPGGGVAFGRFTGGVAESNVFPLSTSLRVDDLWTIQAMVRGTGKLRIGLISWEPEYTSTRSDWGPDTDVWTLPPDGWLHVYALRHAAESTSGLVRFECDGGTFDLDNVLAESDWLKDWPYFDGDSTYGARGDYSWYGGNDRKRKTYSLWYNHKRAVTGRLFAWDISSEDFIITDEEVEEQGFVYKWVPAGVRVTPHLDVLYPGDIQEIVPDNAGTPVTPYKVDDDDAMGVTDPWP